MELMVCIIAGLGVLSIALLGGVMILGVKQERSNV
jgi:hypothetical protein